MFYSDDLIEEVRSRNDIVDLISGYVSLKKKGSSYFGLCPFHNEKSPSFSVSRDKQMYYCFGCGAGGNIFTFLMEYENMTFPEAMQMLADRAGIELPEQETSQEARRAADEKARLREMNKLAAQYYYVLLHRDRGEKGLRYLQQRGILDETIRHFGLGYADIYRDDLYQFLKQKGYTDEEMKNSGLVSIDEKHGGSDKFWNRVMFPIMDVNNRVIGFGGRVMGDGNPKYLNSQETKLFDKSRNLYGLNFARSSRRKELILCEGYLDVISMHQAGFTNAVASLGTAFTSGHGVLLKRYTDRVVLSFDSDDAGIRAANRAIPILKEAGLSIRVLDLSPYKDPDEFIKGAGVEAMEERLRQAKSSFMFQMDQIAGKYRMDDPEDKTKCFHEMAKQLAMIEEPLERRNYIEAVSTAYLASRKELEQLVNHYGTLGISQKQESIKPVRQTSQKEMREESKKQPQKLLLTWLVNEPVLFQRLKGILTPDDFLEPMYHSVAMMLFGQYEEDGQVCPARIINQFVDTEEQKQVAGLFNTTLKMAPMPEDNEKAVTDIVRKVKLASIEAKMSRSNDILEWQELIKEKADIMKLHISL
ncbi:MAG: DNA primase [Anaerostipes sp.]|uniref:DNA primase n=1 Tax=Anaerostipes sp. 992a TaxID=1261637 RepID=UPI000950BEDD|nr:DNA primase [Anaerostipes sp. 992a]MCI5951647.1 DNA primase [Anaerostipes sp.]MDD5969178.1 DNA primase [Anaerostipes sp.]OLR62217.1 DNA primase [Anaerostipes sp. 992a]